MRPNKKEKMKKIMRCYGAQNIARQSPLIIVASQEQE
jgi:hypothetical protein